MKEKKFSLKQKQDYHFKMCKRGATKKDKNGNFVKLSDFERGTHCARANAIFNYRKKCALKKNSLKKGYSEKKVKGVPKWYDAYMRELEEANKKKVRVENSSTDAEMEDLKKYFNGKS